MTDPTLQETFYGPGIDMLLACWDRCCRLEIAVDPASEPFAPQMQCEILLQPRDPRGLATRSPVTVAVETLLLKPTVGDSMWHGQFWLPRQIPPRLARSCYYRLSPL